MKLLILDNYDSFTFNLVHYVEQFCEEVTVVRNDQVSIDEVEEFDAIVLSPGPGLPRDAGIMPELISRFASTKKILGVCLGHQAIGEAFGAKLKNLNQVLHGVPVPIVVLDGNDPFFAGMPSKIETGRYHSWVIDRNTLPQDLAVIATDDNGEVMAIRHREFDVCGVQFHPESLLTEYGLEMIANWIKA